MDESIFHNVKREEIAEKFETLSKDDLIQEHNYWIRRFAVRRWELECRDEVLKHGYATVKALQKDIENYLTGHVSVGGLTKEQIINFVKEDLSFANLVL